MTANCHDDAAVECDTAAESPALSSAAHSCWFQLRGAALNANLTKQTIGQTSSDPAPYTRGVPPDGGVAVQAAGQLAGNKQDAAACAQSVQIAPENTNLSGDGSSTRQSNASTALGIAANLNGLGQTIGQGPADDTLTHADGPGQGHQEQQASGQEQQRTPPTPQPQPTASAQQQPTDAQLQEQAAAQRAAAQQQAATQQAAAQQASNPVIMWGTDSG